MFRFFPMRIAVAVLLIAGLVGDALAARGCGTELARPAGQTAGCEDTKQAKPCCCPPKAAQVRCCCAAAPAKPARPAPVRNEEQKPVRDLGLSHSGLSLPAILFDREELLRRDRRGDFSLPMPPRVQAVLCIWLI